MSHEVIAPRSKELITERDQIAEELRQMAEVPDVIGASRVPMRPSPETRWHLSDPQALGIASVICQRVRLQ